MLLPMHYSLRTTEIVIYEIDVAHVYHSFMRCNPAAEILFQCAESCKHFSKKSAILLLDSSPL